MKISTRTAIPKDAEGVLAIYSPIVKNTAISFETIVPTTEEMAGRIGKTNETHKWLIAEQDAVVVGYAYGSTFRPRAAYTKSAEVTVYVDEKKYGCGIARTLYMELFEILSAKGFHRALAGICLPNEASIALHKALAFTRVGTFHEVGQKFGKWHDVEWWQRSLTQS